MDRLEKIYRYRFCQSQGLEQIYGGPAHYFVKDGRNHTTVNEVIPAAELRRYGEPRVKGFPIGVKTHMQTRWIHGTATETIMIVSGWKDFQIRFRIHHEPAWERK